MKDQNEIHIPYLSPRTIEKMADDFRDKYWSKPLPVDIEHIIDVKLDIRVITVPNLYSRLGIKAYMSSNWKEIMVDREHYENERFRLALNFSYAHEIGHFILHKEVYEALGITTDNDYYCFTEEKNSEGCNFHRNAEIQANMFAKFLMIPTDALLAAKARVLTQKGDQLKDVIGLADSEMVNEYLAIELSEQFGVSDIAVKNALNKLP